MQGKGAAEARSLAPLPIRAHPLVLGVVLFLASELMFFAALFAAFYDIRANHAVWPPAGVHLDIGEPSYGTFLLFVASLVMVFATRAMDKRRIRAARWYTTSAIIAAVGFCLLSVHGYLRYAADGLTLATSAYGSLLYTLTGFHLLHVIVGVGVLFALLVAMRSPAVTANNRAAAEAMTYYWHFVFIVWIGIYTTVFIVGK
ncbi:MAG: cytochrome c oxidase subunit 3 [Candidatus Tyrphobacter sp.]